MLWPTSPDTEVIDGIEYRNVWRKDDPDVRRDATMLGQRVAPNAVRLEPGFWSKDLCVVAYEGTELIALAPGEIRFAERVQQNMAFLRVFVVPEKRERGIVVPLTLKFHEVMRRYALDHPDQKIGGTMAVVTAKGFVDKPVTKAFMVLAGYSPRGEPLIVRWFDHFKL